MLSSRHRKTFVRRAHAIRGGELPEPTNLCIRGEQLQHISREINMLRDPNYLPRTGSEVPVRHPMRIVRGKELIQSKTKAEETIHQDTSCL